MIITKKINSIIQINGGKKKCFTFLIKYFVRNKTEKIGLMLLEDSVYF